MSKLLAKQVIYESGVVFGTSGARGLVEQFTSNVCAAFTLAFLDRLKHCYKVRQLGIAIDNRPSSPLIAQACADALKSQGVEIVFYGIVPTPALAYQVTREGIPGIMVTGSHIPFDRNGLKFYTPDGEISKADEQAIVSSSVLFNPITTSSVFEVNTLAGESYLRRYSSLFESSWLKGKRIGIYEHSSAGRDLYSRLFEKLGAEVISLGRSDVFVPIDTEAVSEEDKEKARDWSSKYNLDLIFSTDGDGDRALIADEKGEYLRGDIIGLLTASELGIEALATPVSCNTAIESSDNFKKVVRTKIGSPYVISACEELAKNHSAVAGFEANGGFLLCSDVTVNGCLLKALPTRDAVLPAIMLLKGAMRSSVSDLVAKLPSRYTHSGRIKNFPTETSRAIMEMGLLNPSILLKKLNILPDVRTVDSTDGLRITLVNGDVVHLRPSGNAPELRCYAEAKTEHMAIKLVDQILSRIEFV